MSSKGQGVGGAVLWGTVVCEGGGHVWGWLWVPGAHGHGEGQGESPCVPHKVSVGPGTVRCLGVGAVGQGCGHPRVPRHHATG